MIRGSSIWSMSYFGINCQLQIFLQLLLMLKSLQKLCILYFGFCALEIWMKLLEVKLNWEQIVSDHEFAVAILGLSNLHLHFQCQLPLQEFCDKLTMHNQDSQIEIECNTEDKFSFVKTMIQTTKVFYDKFICLALVWFQVWNSCKLAGELVHQGGSGSSSE